MKCTRILLSFMFLGSLHVSSKWILKVFAGKEIISTRWLITCNISLRLSRFFGNYAHILDCFRVIKRSSIYYFKTRHILASNDPVLDRLVILYNFLFCCKQNLRWTSAKSASTHCHRWWSRWSEWEKLVMFNFHPISRITCSHQMICLLVSLMISDDADSD